MPRPLPDSAGQRIYRGMQRTDLPLKGSLDHIETWVFDLDNTLYSATSRLFDQISDRIGAYVARHLDIPRDEAARVQKKYFHNYGTTLRGLMLEHKMDPAEFLAYVHDIDFSPLQPHDRLNEALHRLDGRKIIFTNADTPYAKRVMAQLGIDHHFEEIYDIVAANYVPKPYQPAYDLFLERHPFAPDRAIFFEDIARNLGPASEMGMVTVWVQNDGTWDLPGNDTVTPDYETSDLAEWLHAVLDNR